MAFILVLFCSSQAWAETAPRLQKITPYQSGQMIACRLQSSGLPGPKQLQSMQSGLESAIEIHLSVMDKKENVISTQVFSLRLAFDLWEEIFSVRGNGRDQRFSSLDGLQAYLSDLRDLPVSPMARLNEQDSYRIEAQLVPHSIAPTEQQRAEDVISGETRPQREGQDQQEASVSLGRLIRMFYKGGGRSANGLDQLSNWFNLKELSHESH